MFMTEDASLSRVGSGRRVTALCLWADPAPAVARRPWKRERSTLRKGSPVPIAVWSQSLGDF